MIGRLVRPVGLVSLGIGWCGVALLSGSPYLMQVSITTLIFCMLACSLNLLMGTSGLVSLGHMAFCGLGAYASALMSTKLALPLWVSIPAAGIAVAAIGAIVVLPTLRLVSTYFAVATLGIGEIIYTVVVNWIDVTRGPMGIRSIPQLALLGEQGLPVNLIVTGFIAFACMALVYRATYSSYGSSLRALREDELCAQATGLSTSRLKLEVFALSAFIAGVAGALIAHTTGYISPDNFRFSESILLLAMVVVGGLGSVAGSIIGAIVLIGLPELLRDVGNFRMLFVGVLLFLSIRMMPHGVLGEAYVLALLRSQKNENAGAAR